MDLMEFLNLSASAVIFFGVTWAVYSKHICDGVIIKITMVGLAFGAAADFAAVLRNMSTGYAKLWIMCSVAAFVLAIFLRLLHAKICHEKPCFISYSGAPH